MPSAPSKARWAVMSTVRKDDNWVVASREVVNLCMGDARLDLRAATLTSHETTIVIQGIMCSAKVIVPDTWRVECDGTAIMGEFRQKNAGAAPTADPSAPLVRVVGGVLMGECIVYRTGAAVGEGSLAVDGIKGWKARRRSGRLS